MGPTPPGKTRDRIFQFVKNRILAGMPPTVREVQQAFGFAAVQTARHHLESLVREGRLVKLPGKARGYGLAGSTGSKALMVPVLGRVQAGALTRADQVPDGYVPLQTRNREAEHFALRVQGESMTGAGILPGDLVMVRRQPTARSGDIVVALVGEEATVKRLFIRGKRLELRPENPDFDVIQPNPEELVILGKVVEVRRYLDGQPPWNEFPDAP